MKQIEPRCAAKHRSAVGIGTRAVMRTTMVLLSMVLSNLNLHAGALEIEHGQFSLSVNSSNGAIEAVEHRGFGAGFHAAPAFAICLRGEADTNDTELTFSDFALTRPVKAGRKGVTAAYRDSRGAGVAVDTSVTFDAPDELVWRIRVANRGSRHVLRVTFPVLTGLRLSADGSGDTLFWHGRHPRLIQNPAQSPPEPFQYPRAPMNFVDLSDGARGIAIFGNPDLVMNRFSVTNDAPPGALEVRLERINGIPPGRADEAVYRVRWHAGDWHAAADLYREAFRRRFPRPEYPDWIRRANGYLAIYAPGSPEPPYRSPTRFQINEAWRLGLDHLQYWGQTGQHACPGYPLPDPMRGGEAAFTAMVRQIRDAGLHTGGYFYSCGIGKFEVLSPSFRGVPWGDMPAEVRPPSWGWVVTNSLYGTPERTPPTQEMASSSWNRAKVSSVAEAAAKNLCPQVLHDLNFLSPAFRAWLRFWAVRYHEVYGADVPYLDVYAFRPKVPDFSPYFGKFGDGTEGQQRFAFLKDLVAEQRKVEKSFVPMTEGMLDAYTLFAPGVASGMRQFIEGYRYTFPDHLVYEGNANGYWMPPHSRLAISYAYLEGNRFDLIGGWCNANEAERMIWLRDAFMPWIAEGRYMGSQGFTLSVTNVQACWIDAGQPLGSSLVNCRNVDLVQDATLTLAAPLDAGHRRAFVFTPDGEIRRVDDLSVPLRVPAATVSSILLAGDSPRARLLPVLIPEMTTQGMQYAVSVANLSGKKRTVALAVRSAEGGPERELLSATMEPFGCVARRVAVPLPAAPDRAARLLFTFRADNEERVFRRTWDPMVEDPSFEWNEAYLARTSAVARAGSFSLAVPANSHAAIPLKLAPRAAYELRVAFLRPHGTRPGAAIWDPRFKKTLAEFRETGASEAGKWGEILGRFTTGEDGWLELFLQNRGATAPLYYDDLRLRPVEGP